MPLRRLVEFFNIFLFPVSFTSWCLSQECCQGATALTLLLTLLFKLFHLYSDIGVTMSHTGWHWHYLGNYSAKTNQQQTTNPSSRCHFQSTKKQWYTSNLSKNRFCQKQYPIFAGSNLSNVRILCLSLSSVMINWIFLGCGLLVGLNKTFEDVAFVTGRILKGIFHYCLTCYGPKNESK